MARFYLVRNLLGRSVLTAPVVGTRATGARESARIQADVAELGIGRVPAFTFAAAYGATPSAHVRRILVIAPTSKGQNR